MIPAHETNDSEMFEVPHFLRDRLFIPEIQLILMSGTHPVFFAKDQEDYIWGLGTLFLLQWHERQFAITAKHVIENQQADFSHLRIIIQGNEAALPISGASIPSHPRHSQREEIEDLVVFHVPKDPYLADCKVEWDTWRMPEFWKPASQLQVGQQIFTVGYPFNENRFDYENNKINLAPMLVVGKLSADSLGDDLYCIDCEPFPVDDLNGFSGAPVFARFEGLFYYVGMVIRGGAEARKIHFMDATYVTFALNEVYKKLTENS